LFSVRGASLEKHEDAQRRRFPLLMIPQVKDRILNRDGQDEQDGIEMQALSCSSGPSLFKFFAWSAEQIILSGKQEIAGYR
jgi:hypothetical protein